MPGIVEHAPDNGDSELPRATTPENAQNPPRPPHLVGDTVSKGQKIAGFHARGRVGGGVVDEAEVVPDGYLVPLSNLGSTTHGAADYSEELEPYGLPLDEGLIGKFHEVLDRLDWTPFIRRLFEAASKLGHRLFLVGGSVRDVLRGGLPTDVNDVDCTGTLPFGEAVELIRAVYEANSSALWPSLGVDNLQIPGNVVRVLAPVGDRGWTPIFEYQMLQQKFLRQNLFRFGTDITEDTRFRDLTVNAILIDPLRGMVYDPTDKALTGLSDLGYDVKQARTNKLLSQDLFDSESSMKLRIVDMAPPGADGPPQEWAGKNISRLLKFLDRGLPNRSPEHFRQVDVPATGEILHAWVCRHKDAVHASFGTPNGPPKVAASFASNLKAAFTPVGQTRDPAQSEEAAREIMHNLLEPLKIGLWDPVLERVIRRIGIYAARPLTLTEGAEEVVGVGVRPLDVSPDGASVIGHLFAEFDGAPGSGDRVGLNRLLDGWTPGPVEVTLADPQSLGAQTYFARGWSKPGEIKLVEIDSCGEPIPCG